MTETTRGSTLLSERLRNTGKILRESAEQQIRDHSSRFEMINQFYDELFRGLLVQAFNKKQALKTALTMFGTNEFNFAAVDGTEYSKPIFDMVAFFGGSYAAEGTVTLTEEGAKVSYKDEEFVKQGIGISSCAPVYVDKIPEIDQVFMDISQPGELNLRKQLGEDTVIDNTSISNWIMTFSEFYLAYKLAIDSDRNVKLILLDRNLSGMLSSILYDTSKRKMWKTSCAIHGLEVDGKAIDENELAYGRQRLVNRGLNVPSARGDYLRYRLIQLVEEKGPLSKEKIPIYVDFDSLVRYHFGVFCFTGGGKSNLISNIVRRILYHTQDTRIVLFDISSEYPFLLTDVFLDKKIDSKIVLESKVTGVEQFYASVVKSKEYENDDRVKKAFKVIFDQGKVTYYLKPRVLIPTFESLFQELDDFRKDSVGKAHYVDAIDRIREAISDYVNDNGLSDMDPIDEQFVDVLDRAATEAVQDFKVSDKAGLYAWATTRSTLKDRLVDKQKDKGGMKTEDIRKLIEDQSRLTCVSISDPFTIKELVIGLTSEMLSRRKKQFKVRPYVLFVFDEAQEFVPDLSSSQGIEKQCSKQVETLLRQGRKYGLGGCISTQRIAHLNTSALQQLHTYFVGTLPRPYDRALVSNTFTIDQGILEKTLEFAPEEWLLSSYIATGIENVPIFIKSDNAENEVSASFK